MINLGFYPKILLDIIGHIPTIAFKTISVPRFLLKSKKLIKDYNSEKLANKVIADLNAQLPAHISIVGSVSSHTATDSKMGELVLELYFSQLKNTSGVILDLRQKHFEYADGVLLWSPNSLAYEFSESFRSSLLTLYRGFYQDDLSLMKQAFSDLGLSKNLSEDKTNELCDLFKSHFGADTNAVDFNLEDFHSSFRGIFHFMIEHKVEMDVDFIFLGIYLITLYTHLESYQCSFDVQNIYHRVFND